VSKSELKNYLTVKYLQDGEEISLEVRKSAPLYKYVESVNWNTGLLPDLGSVTELMEGPSAAIYHMGQWESVLVTLEAKIKSCHDYETWKKLDKEFWQAMRVYSTIQEIIQGYKYENAG
jgi:hypothetical protein